MEALKSKFQQSEKQWGSHEDMFKLTWNHVLKGHDLWV
jgi:hypothetical protein